MPPSPPLHTTSTLDSLIPLLFAINGANENMLSLMLFLTGKKNKY
jgi:hypothetical protein